MTVWTKITFNSPREIDQFFEEHFMYYWLKNEKGPVRERLQNDEARTYYDNAVRTMEVVFPFMFAIGSSSSGNGSYH